VLLAAVGTRELHDQKGTFTSLVMGRGAALGAGKSGEWKLDVSGTTGLGGYVAER
jgi:hypothetical protein